MRIIAKTCLRSAVVAAGLSFLPIVAAADTASSWQAVEKEQLYAVEGRTGPELYASIGARGPQAGNGTRAIAHTTFKLTWTRKYEPQGNACVLVSARPKLIITYTLPKATGRLPAPVQASWDRFIAGVRKHERVHGVFITDLVKAIEAVSVDLSVADDPGCRKIRTELTKKLGVLSREERQKNRDFDRDELSPGGNVHTLILSLVNGP